jgi:hypothetical protein
MISAHNSLTFKNSRLLGLPLAGLLLLLLRPART